MATRRRLSRFLTSILDVRVLAALPRLLHFYNYDHVRPRRSLHLGADVGLAPTVSLRVGSHIHIGDNSRIGSRCSLWAGARASIRIGSDTTLGPGVFVTVSNYALTGPGPPMKAMREERDVMIGDGVWLGTGVTVLPGVTIGDGCVVGANTVVSRSLPANSIAVGSRATVIRERG